jgi:hypothetical protein
VRKWQAKTAVGEVVREIVKARFKELAKTMHPDKQGGSEAAFRRFLAARDYLRGQW